mmetsp:Transcript_18709/g.48186  ORF Transcript_18709/g.48186 Transcript_18709/m.48186 type:complete len:111 (-) Transcript_18709:212-544(-)
MTTAEPPAPQCAASSLAAHATAHPGGSSSDEELDDSNRYDSEEGGGPLRNTDRTLSTHVPHAVLPLDLPHSPRPSAHLPTVEHVSTPPEEGTAGEAHGDGSGGGDGGDDA